VTGSACDSICDSFCVCRFAIEMWSLAVNCESDVDVCANGDCKFATADAWVWRDWLRRSRRKGRLVSTRTRTKVLGLSGSTGCG